MSFLHHNKSYYIGETALQNCLGTLGSMDSELKGHTNKLWRTTNIIKGGPRYSCAVSCKGFLHGGKTNYTVISIKMVCRFHVSGSFEIFHGLY